jgi:outer membrane protein OmpA-like peptidoglycan-associated protein
MYFSRNNYYENKKIKDDSGVMHVGIYSAELVEGLWMNVKQSNLNSSQHTVYHPSLSKDGKQLYFASDMPGGIGGMDIYVSAINEDASLGTPVNLGPEINTEGNEVFPSIHHDDNTLYFSSDGLVGLGLLDVFAGVRGADGNFVNAINLAEPINSKKDDFGYYLADDSFSGYLSSNRKGGVGGDDIYAFTRIPPLMMKGKIVDAINNRPIAGATVVLKTNSGEDLATFVTNEDGSYEQIIPRERNFVLQGSKEKYQDAHKTFTSKGLSKQREVIVDLNIGLIPVLDVVVLADLNIIYFDFDKSYIRPDAAEELDKVVKLMVDEYPGMVIRLESHTDSRFSDEYNLTLSQKRATSTYQYFIDNGVDAARITKYEGFGETMLLDVKTAEGTKVCSNGVKCTEEEHQLNRRTEFIIIKMK